MAAETGPRTAQAYVILASGAGGRAWYVGRGSGDGRPILPTRDAFEALTFDTKAKVGEWVEGLPDHVRSGLASYRLGAVDLIPTNVDRVPITERHERGQLK